MNAGSIYREACTRFPKPVEGALRVYWIPQVPGKPFYWPVPDLKTAGLLMDALAAYDDFQFYCRVRGDYCNVGGLEIFEDGDHWTAWESEEGEDFDEYRERMEAQKHDKTKTQG